jgi:hypothetical protein
MTDMFTAKVTRGPQSWAFFYVTLGFALTIEDTIIQMISPLKISLEFNCICSCRAANILFIY